MRGRRRHRKKWVSHLMALFERQHLDLPWSWGDFKLSRNRVGGHWVEVWDRYERRGFVKSNVGPCRSGSSTDVDP